MINPIGIDFSLDKQITFFFTLYPVVSRFLLFMCLSIVPINLITLH